jgi:outer membrane protein, heavy metal efflux system
MLRSALLPATTILLSLPPPTAAAQEPLTLDQALGLARERAPAVLAARLQVEEARGRSTGARALLAENPTLSGGLGRRRSPGETWAGAAPEARLELVQPIELGGQRGARVAAAEAELAAASASGEGVLRRIEGEVAWAFYRGLHAAERLRLATATQEALARSAGALERRHQAGDVPVLDLNLARTALARATAEVRAARALGWAARGELAGLLGLPGDAPLLLDGDLRRQRRYDRQRLLQRAGDSPEARALLAGARAAEAEAALGRAQRWPRLGLGAAFEREGEEDILLGTVALELPLFQRGQGLRATGEARARRLALEADAARRSAQASVRAAFGAHSERVAAARALEEALPLVQDNEALATRSYEAGQLSLAEWIVVRREALETRADYVDRLLDAAEAGIALALAAGVSP